MLLLLIVSNGLLLMASADPQASSSSGQQQQFAFGGPNSVINSPMWNSCLDLQGVRRQNGEEWTVRQHFVMLCHQVPSDVGQMMRAETTACLREDGKTRIAIGSEAEEQPGWTLVCRREPTGEVRREWRIAGGRRVPIGAGIGGSMPIGSSSVACLGAGCGGALGFGLSETTRSSGFSSSAMGMGARTFSIRSAVDTGLLSSQQLTSVQTGSSSPISSGIPGNGFSLVGGMGCYEKPIGTRWQHNSFEFECASQLELPKLIACLPPELNGQKVPAGETKNVGPYTVICEQRADGTYAWRWFITPFRGTNGANKKQNDQF